MGDIRSTGTYTSSVVYTRHTDTSWVWKQMRMEIVLSSILRWMSDNGFCWTNDELNVYIALYIGTCCMLRFYLSHFSLFRLLIYLFYVDTIIKRVFINYTLCLLWLCQWLISTNYNVIFKKRFTVPGSAIFCVSLQFIHYPSAYVCIWYEEKQT